jgi:hypothetical protein
MTASWKKALLLLGVATAVLATPVLGIEVRYDNVTSPRDIYAAQSAAVSFARSRAFDFVRCSPECVSTSVFLEKCLEGRLVCIRSLLNIVRLGLAVASW